MSDRPIDLQWTTSHEDLQQALSALCVELGKSEKDRKRTRRASARVDFDECAKAIVLDLYRAHLSDAALEVGIPAGRTYLSDLAKSPYSPSFLTARAFSGALGALTSQNWIACTRGFKKPQNGKPGQTRRYRATDALVTYLEAAGASIVVLERRANAEGIILKDTEKKPISYGSSSFVDQCRERLDCINRTLLSHWYDLDISDEELRSLATKFKEGSKNEETAQPVSFAARSLHRIFNNGEWEQGGRFYGGWWQTVPSALRAKVLIDGKRTVEVDYSGLHAAMLFAEAGRGIPEDPYERCLNGSNNKALRTCVKRTFNALLNAASVQKLQPVEGYSDQLSGMNWSDFKAMIINRFPEFAGHFGSAVGLRLQGKDSQLAEYVMLQFTEMRYPCLPVHDSFLVHHALEEELKEAMDQAFLNIFGVHARMKSDRFVESSRGTGQPIDFDILDENIFLDQGFNKRLNKWFEYKDSTKSDRATTSPSGAASSLYS